MSYFTTIFHHTPFASHLQNNLQISLQLNCATAFFAIRKVTEEKNNNIFGHSLFQKAILNHRFSLLLAYYKSFFEKLV